MVFFLLKYLEWEVVVTVVVVVMVVEILASLHDHMQRKKIKFGGGV